MKKTRVVSLRLTEDEFDSLDKLAQLRGVNVSDVLRQLINTPPTTQYWPYPTTMTTTTSDVKYFRWNGDPANV